MKSYADLPAELDELLLLGKEKHQVVVALNRAETTGIVSNASVDTVKFEREESLCKIGL